MSEDKKSPAKDLLAYIREHGLDRHGSFISAKVVRNVIGIELPEVATREEFQLLSMYELSSVDYVRKVLLGEGKYLAQSKGDYRILLPSENASQIASYMSSADKKLKRALILSKNTPGKATSIHDAEQVEARIQVKRESIRTHRPLGDVGHNPPSPMPGRMPEAVRAQA